MKFIPRLAALSALAIGGLAAGTGIASAGTSLPHLGAATTALLSSVNPAGTGQTVVYTAIVSPAPGGGTVKFTDDGTVISGCAAVPVTGTTAACTTTAGAKGGHQILASFSGSSGYASSESSVLTEVVAAASCPTLAGCDLQGLNLAGANLAGDNLAGANLAGANLTQANLSGANLTGANLSSATLTDANLSGANLTSANLTSAKLSLANLARANLTAADLAHATMVFASLGGATWSGTTCPDGTSSNADHGTCAGHL